MNTLSKAFLAIAKRREKRMKAPICKPGKHDLKISSVMGGHSKTLDCTICMFQVTVPLDAHEKALWNQQQKVQEKESKEIHALGWKYQKHFYKYEPYTMTDEQWILEKKNARLFNKGKKKKIKPKRVRHLHKGFKWSGWELMQEFERFAKNNPGVIITGCDDAYHASSYIVQIPHRSKNQYWGTTVIIVPQMGPFPPTEFFLYPDHAHQLVEALKPTVDESEAKEKKTRKHYFFPGNSIPKGFKAEGL